MIRLIHQVNLNKFTNSNYSYCTNTDTQDSISHSAHSINSQSNHTYTNSLPFLTRLSHAHQSRSINFSLRYVLTKPNRCSLFMLSWIDLVSVKAGSLKIASVSAFLLRYYCSYQTDCLRSKIYFCNILRPL